MLSIKMVRFGTHLCITLLQLDTQLNPLIKVRVWDPCHTENNCICDALGDGLIGFLGVVFAIDKDFGVFAVRERGVETGMSLASENGIAM
jgi:hypothetical protein